MKTDDFDYYLPEELIAQVPLEHREESRLLVLDKNNGDMIDDKFYDEKYRVEWYMLPEEAKSHKICDYIIGKDCTLDEII